MPLGKLYQGIPNRLHQQILPDQQQGFVRKSDLERHFRIHSGERPFLCPEEGCLKAFAQKGGLKTHSRVHSGEKPHHCSQCTKSFADAGNPVKVASIS
jgi:uncharacterized Zn-finger protein